ncbi:probable ubiquitin-like-specific protease 2A [Quercus suber]|uniref:probable ubiquitin-like-specific protease 2A n=1 Tax=Quercus suber TaxID=58331 RepID=UPI0032DFE2C1
MRKSQRMGRKERKLVETTSIIDVDSPSPTSASMKAHSNLTKEEADMRKWGFLTDSSMILVDFPRRRRSKRKIKSKNATAMQNKLDSGAFECYFQNLWRSFSEDKKTSFTYLDCLWFELHRKSAYKDKVLTWIQKKDIFSKKYVLVPIVCWRHWSLLIFCHFGESTKSETRTPCMLLLDSLEKANPRRLEPDIRKFVLDIYEAEGRLETKDFIYQIPLLVPKVPQQRNGEECGSFVLFFINLFMESAPEDFSTQHFPYFMKDNWFTPEGLKSFCEKIESLKENSDVDELL